MKILRRREWVSEKKEQKNFIMILGKTEGNRIQKCVKVFEKNLWCHNGLGKD